VSYESSSSVSRTLQPQGPRCMDNVYYIMRLGVAFTRGPASKTCCFTQLAGTPSGRWRERPQEGANPTAFDTFLCFTGGYAGHEFISPLLGQARGEVRDGANTHCRAAAASTRGPKRRGNAR
jgi:hypothetical protein